ncbi:S-adenosylmethionine--tRNA ribosyltransferase-isomerase [Seinonella peptonophila]|uniref:S-adenosylmethionine:tRNA ribosyltransferase-isomerase n=1 Tax=Seinonella peptonophila TaxID=112248 RepID=A0A1M4TRK8_9BACL|nr:tRNA preQ1(34) S-adenosylmethionine ribosyltransferase-isomerase QueA [Seinonella peptonophila]SHE47048.1 S-adenosylmethionine--tRNA ribosyltransferase-isomerase [Seinonella peptonophila]
MDIAEFDFHLPKELIAQKPISERSQSRLLVLNRETGEREHTIFAQLPHYLREGDLLVLNNTRVRPARLIGIKQETGAKIELLLLQPLGEDRWEALVKPARRVKKGTVIQFGNGELVAIAEQESKVDGGRLFRLEYDPQRSIEELFEELGKVPLPPYIHEELNDPERYQTVYSYEVGSAAAPTAGLHFTHVLLDQCNQKGVDVAFLTLHVGLGTFRPVSVSKIEEHKMHAEFFQISQQTLEKIKRTKKRGGRVIAVGTTAVRTLETIGMQIDHVKGDQSGWTDIFIYPGYQFQIVDGMITNFHLPKSTLLMLVSAFCSRERILTAYQEAIDRRYRFFSFGDAMFIY